MGNDAPVVGPDAPIANSIYGPKGRNQYAGASDIDPNVETQKKYWNLALKVRGTPGCTTKSGLGADSFRSRET